jgi:hypothetical protein
MLRVDDPVIDRAIDDDGSAMSEKRKCALDRVEHSLYIGVHDLIEEWLQYFLNGQAP